MLNRQDVSDSASPQGDCPSRQIEEEVYAMERRSLLRVLAATLLAWTTRRAQALLRPPTVRSSLTDSQGVSTSSGPSALLVRIDMVVGKSTQYQRAVGEVVRRSLLNVLKVPKHNWFETINVHSVDQMPFDRNYLGIHRTDDCVFIQITLGVRIGLELKKRFYKAVADGLHRSIEIKREDVFINLVEVPEENWSLRPT
ncbi:tautomerase family protein [Granulicella sibirica]|uniref:tautomerase family protein n=1 Tax=Granulicella sibirica TaxID=2479048 RepID=UPI0019D60A17|nr:tautomerase family protein [Granulicella sibirica]